MIRGSVAIAVIAVLLSLIAHLAGLSFTAPALEGQAAQEQPSDAVALGNAFEDLAEPVAEPPEPEPAEPPEQPPVETPPEPEAAEVPVSEALVASEDPQRVFSPDFGESSVVQPVESEPEPNEPAEPSDSDATASDDTDVTPPVETDAAPEIPEGSAEPATAPEAEAEALASLPEIAEPTPPVSAQSPVPVVPLQQDQPQPDIAVAPSETGATEPVENDSSETGTEQAVTASLRPRLPDRSQATEPPGTKRGARDFSDLRFPRQVVESPLSLYKREGLDAFTSGDSGETTGGRGPGNSDRTNYAGLVLVHLNRSPAVYVSSRGFARVFFEINPDGTLAWVDIVDSSGSPEVDRAAKEQVQRAAPFPKPPGGVSRKLSFFYQKS